MNNSKQDEKNQSKSKQEEQVIGKSQTEMADQNDNSETYPNNKREKDAKAPNLARLQDLHNLRDKGDLTPGEQAELDEIEGQVRQAQDGKNGPVDLRPSADVPEENRP